MPGRLGSSSAARTDEVLVMESPGMTRACAAPPSSIRAAESPGNVIRVTPELGESACHPGHMSGTLQE